MTVAYSLLYLKLYFTRNNVYISITLITLHGRRALGQCSYIPIQQASYHVTCIIVFYVVNRCVRISPLTCTTKSFNSVRVYVMLCVVMASSVLCEHFRPCFSKPTGTQAAFFSAHFPLFLLWAVYSTGV